MTHHTPLVPDNNYFHSLLDEKKYKYSPFNYQQERILDHKDTNIGLVFSSQALGYDLIPDALEHMLSVRYDALSLYYITLPNWSRNPTSMTIQLDSILDSTATTSHQKA